MATLHTGLPKRAGERALAARLSKIQDPKLHLWFGLDYIPGTRDVDCLIWHEDVGVFVVEVKAIDLNMIGRFGLDVCVVRDRSGTETPQRQAYSAGTALRQFLAPLMRREGVPWINCTACWPIISRHRWRARWNDAYIADELASSMLFDDDLGEPEELVNRLQHIKKLDPPSRRPVFISVQALAKTSSRASCRRGFGRTAEPKSVPSDSEAIAEPCRREDPNRKSASSPWAGLGQQSLLFGLSGGGEKRSVYSRSDFFTRRPAAAFSLRLLSNKVLASDVRRLLCHSKRVREAKGNIEIVDVFDLLRTYAAEHGVTSIEQDHDGWGELITSEMKKNIENVVKYDTILIDESPRT